MAFTSARPARRQFVAFLTAGRERKSIAHLQCGATEAPRLKPPGLRAAARQDGGEERPTRNKRRRAGHRRARSANHAARARRATMRGRTRMLYRSSIRAITFVGALCVTMAGAWAWDDSKYHDFSGQWRPIGGAGGLPPAPKNPPPPREQAG